MHLRYDLPGKLNVNNFTKQASHFLNKENCIFSFYFSDFAVTFAANKDIEYSDKITINCSISEQKNVTGKGVMWLSIIPSQDYRMKDLPIIEESFECDSNVGISKHESIKLSIDYIICFVRIIAKINDLFVFS